MRQYLLQRNTHLKIRCQQAGPASIGEVCTRHGQAGQSDRLYLIICNLIYK